MDKEEENRNDLPEKTIIISGNREQADRARKEIDSRPGLSSSCSTEEPHAQVLRAAAR
jgi:hypothetical protein